MKRRRSNPEEQIHKSIVTYLRAVLPHAWKVQHTPNGGALKGEAGRAKGMGAIAGWPDLAIYGRIETPVTYFLEVKAPGGRVADHQCDVHDGLTDLGFPVAVVRSIDDVRAFIAKHNLPSREVA